MKKTSPENYPSENVVQESSNGETNGRMTFSRFNPNARITEGMIRRPRREPTSHKNPRMQVGPTWDYLFMQIIVGLIEILVPLAFIVGMTYWRAPWLFWAVLHFLRGEQIFHF